MNSRDEWERMIAGWAPVPTKELSMSEEIKLSTEEIDAMRDGLEAIGYGSTAAAIKQLQQQLAAAREALQAAEADAARYRFLRDQNANIDNPDAWAITCCDFTDVEGPSRYWVGSDLDAAIDATLQRDRQP